MENSIVLNLKKMKLKCLKFVYLEIVQKWIRCIFTGLFSCRHHSEIQYVSMFGKGWIMVINSNE